MLIKDSNGFRVDEFVRSQDGGVDRLEVRGALVLRASDARIRCGLDSCEFLDKWPHLVDVLERRIKRQDVPIDHSADLGGQLLEWTRHGE